MHIPLSADCPTASVTWSAVVSCDVTGIVASVVMVVSTTAVGGGVSFVVTVVVDGAVRYELSYIGLAN